MLLSRGMLILVSVPRRRSQKIQQNLGWNPIMSRRTRARAAHRQIAIILCHRVPAFDICGSACDRLDRNAAQLMIHLSQALLSCTITVRRSSLLRASIVVEWRRHFVSH
ncbi:hypothetical protein DFH06DRAFT_1191829 [Mycena polygramma]|nr:hypothetical protein DFH06DRAFT_1191829 [Mycena polygramma]